MTGNRTLDDKLKEGRERLKDAIATTAPPKKNAQQKIEEAGKTVSRDGKIR